MKRNIKTAVITGPTGAVGTALCRKLLQENIKVYAVCRPGSNRRESLPTNDDLHIVDCDLSDYKTLKTKLHGITVDAFFHFAWSHTIGTGRNDMQAQINNIRYTIDAVNVAKELGSKVFIGAGSQAEYGRVEGMLKPDTPTFPENGYGMAKLCAGQMSRLESEKLGLDHIWPRILSVYGPRDGSMTMISSAISQLKEGKKPAFTAGEQEWDYLFSEDAANAFYLMALYGHSGSIYPLGSGKTKKLKEYIKILRDQIDPKLPLGIGEIPYGPNQVMFLQADITKLQMDTGFEPEIDFEEGIRITINSIK